MTSRLLVAALAFALLGGMVGGIARSTTPRTPAPDAPDASVAPAAAAHSGCLLLTVEIDHRGVRVLQATRKPALAFRAPRHADEMDFRWALTDADGDRLAAGGFDPARICLDPGHAGRPAHVEGDVLVPHVAHLNVKVPDLAGTVTVEFSRRDGGRELQFGTARRDALPIR